MKTPRVASLLVLALLATALPLAASPDVTRDRPEGETLLMTRHVNGAITATAYQRAVLPGRPFQVSRVTVYVATISGGGAGSSTFRVGDGTNNCDCVLACTSSNSTGGKVASCSGTCTFAPGADLVLSVPTTTCTTTQPAVMSIDVRGFWR